MRWACPHCQTSLHTQEGAKETAEPVGPRPGWVYARCFQCDEYAVVDLATSRAEPIAHPRRKTLTPPPFQRISAPEPVVAAPIAPATQAEPPTQAEPAQEPVITATLIAPPSDASEATQDLALELPTPLPALPQETRSSGIPLSVFVLFAGFLVLTTGLTLHWSTRSLVTAPPVRPAAGPIIAQAIAQARPEAPTNVIHAPPLSQPAPSLAAQPERLDSDSVRSQAGAPRRARAEEIQLYLQARQHVRSMELHTGPGMEYPLMGLADLDERYPVLEIRGRWFRVQLEETPGLNAWVAYERVELFSHDQLPTKAPHNPLLDGDLSE